MKIEESISKHFLILVARGRHPAASGGEKRAYRLARAIAADLPGLDSKAITGLVQFIAFTAQHPMEAADLVEEEE